VGEYVSETLFKIIHYVMNSMKPYVFTVVTKSACIMRSSGLILVSERNVLITEMAVLSIAVITASAQKKFVHIQIQLEPG
jgi:hypothetical protein